MGTWWGEGHAGREAAGLEPRDNLSKPVERKKKETEDIGLDTHKDKEGRGYRKKGGTARGDWWERGRGMC